MGGTFDGSDDRRHAPTSTGAERNVSADAAFVEAVKAGDLIALKKSVEDGADINQHAFFIGATALVHCASDDSRIALLKYLLKCKADLSGRDWGGDSALMNAALFGQVENTKCLLEAGIDTELQNKNGDTAVVLAEYRNHKHIADLIRAAANILEAEHAVSASIEDLEKGFKEACLQQDFDIETIKKYLDAGVDIRKTPFTFGGKDTGNALHQSSFHDRENELLRFFLKHDPGLINLQDSAGDSALHFTVYQNASKNAETLIELGIDTEIRNHDGLTALEFAQQQGKQRLSEAIIEAAYIAKNSKDGFLKENDYTISQFEELDRGEITLRKSFNFASREITTISKFGLVVQQFKDIENQDRIKAAAEALKALRGNPGNWQAYKPVSPAKPRLT